MNLLPEDLTDEEFLELIKPTDPAFRVLARIERAKQQIRTEQKHKEDTPCSGSQSSSASSF